MNGQCNKRAQRFKYTQVSTEFILNFEFFVVGLNKIQFKEFQIALNVKK